MKKQKIYKKKVSKLKKKIFFLKKQNLYKLLLLGKSRYFWTRTFFLGYFGLIFFHKENITFYLWNFYLFFSKDFLRTFSIILQIFSTFWRKISIVEQIFDFWANFRFLIKIFSFWSKFSVFGQNFRFYNKFSIFDQKFRSLSNFFNFDQNFRFFSKFSKKKISLLWQKINFWKIFLLYLNFYTDFFIKIFWIPWFPELKYFLARNSHFFLIFSKKSVW